MKPLLDFHRLRSSPDGRQPRCKVCHSGQMAKYRASWTPEKRRRSIRRDNLRSKFGMSLDDYDRMLEKQGGVCAICLQGETAVRSGVVLPLAVDHCHATGAIRGLLCVGCNTGIGSLKDDADLLRSAITYLERS